MGGKSRKGNRVSAKLVQQLKDNADKKEKTNGSGSNLFDKDKKK